MTFLPPLLLLFVSLRPRVVHRDYLTSSSVWAEAGEVSMCVCACVCVCMCACVGGTGWEWLTLLARALNNFNYVRTRSV